MRSSNNAGTCVRYRAVTHRNLRVTFQVDTPRQLLWKNYPQSQLIKYSLK